MRSSTVEVRSTAAPRPLCREINGHTYGVFETCRYTDNDDGLSKATRRARTQLRIVAPLDQTARSVRPHSLRATRVRTSRRTLSFELNCCVSASSLALLHLSYFSCHPCPVELDGVHETFVVRNANAVHHITRTHCRAFKCAEEGVVRRLPESAAARLLARRLRRGGRDGGAG